MLPKPLTWILAGVLLGGLAWAAPIARAGLKPVLLVPIYVFPHSWGVNEYVRLINLQKRYPNLPIVAIVNVDFDGPDWKTNPGYRAQMGEIVRSLAGAGIVVLGYASSSYTRRPFQGDPKGSGFGSDLRTNVDRWIRFFPQVRGIFVDEMCYSLTLYRDQQHPCLPLEASRAPLGQAEGRPYRDVMAYYRAIYAYIRQSKGLELVIANPGQTVPPAFFDGSVADALIVYEGSEAYFDPTVYPLGGNPDRTGLLLYNDPAPFALPKLRAVLGKVGFFYVTDAMLVDGKLNPWAALPRYLEELADYLASPQP
ncbi:MAG: spherulation-specific family 4 protein [Thermaceae bacterium]|nr:spherulation-specific family 4 protein [Thermaceae bacterium]